MRYTTIIDITEYSECWRNKNVVLLYLYLCLKCGYHNEDRDLIQISTREMGYRTGLSHSAVRNSIKSLMKFKLISKESDGKWRIVKWVMPEEIKARPKTAKQAKARADLREEDEKRINREREYAARKAEREKLEEQGKTDFMVYYEAQLEKASQGDKEAAKIVEKQRPVYEAHKQAIQSKLNQKKS